VESSLLVMGSAVAVVTSVAFVVASFVASVVVSAVTSVTFVASSFVAFVVVVSAVTSVAFVVGASSVLFSAGVSVADAKVQKKMARRILLTGIVDG